MPVGVVGGWGVSPHPAQSLCLGAADKMTAWIQPYPPAPTMYHQLMLSCEVTGDASVKEFLWEKKGSREPLQKGQSNVLIFSSFNKSHLGTYTCTATGPQGTAVATYDLWINDLVNQVFVFPRETKDSYVVLRAKPEQPLLNFTVCLRSYTDLTRPHSLFSYATKAQDNEILLSKPKPTEYRFYVGGQFVTFRVPESFSESEHACASWESPTGIARFWLNGKPWPRKGLQKDYAVGAEAVILLGQEQDNFGGGFDVRQSFVGEISAVYMWDRELTAGEVRDAMYNSPSPAPIFGWRNLPYKIHGEVYLKG
ncbi:serum amyloid P-component-like [Aythya fuligula]|uniref:C-reactive protein n=1 Tax=Aythya fuligula TaxID=219594 RepID=A0A6J3EFX5_AYTFU|nr:serum amyloid P-component-like [Aythya fuligula]